MPSKVLLLLLLLSLQKLLLVTVTAQYSVGSSYDILNDDWDYVPFACDTLG